MATRYDPFAGEGKLRALLRTRDWSNFALGFPDAWPGPLKTALQLMLDSSQSTSLAWGPQLHFFYNDAYIEVLGEKHPSALARPFWEVWPEVKHDFRQEMERTLRGKPCFRVNVPFQIMRHGGFDETWFTYSLLPILDDDGNVAGVFNPVMETTRQVIAERRQAFQLELADRLRPLTVPGDIVAAASELLGRRLDASRVLYAEIDDASGTFFIRRDWNSHGLPSIAGEVRRLDDFGPEIIATLRAGKPILIDDTRLDPRTTSYADAYAMLGIRANLAISLVKSGRMTTVLSVQHVNARHWTESDIHYAEDMAERTWLAVESARVQAELRAERDQSQYIFDSMSETFAILDPAWTVVQINAKGLRLAQRTASEIIGRNHWDLWPELIGTEIEALYKRVMRTRIAGTVEDTYTLPHGKKLQLEVRAYPALNGGIAIFIRDITKRKNAEKQIQEALQHDNLTGLPARSLLNEYCSHILAGSMRSGEAGAILFIDLDRFKPINDLHGHEVGDKVLQEVAQRLLACTRKESIVSRLGGDEFVVVLPHIESPHDPATVAQHIVAEIGKPLFIGALQLHVSSSIGISLFPQHGNALEPLIRCADLAMYAAKKGGRNNFKMYSEALNQGSNDLLHLENLLKHSLENDRMALVYQPILDVQSRQLIGTEALIRMPAEDGALILPAEFIPLAEATGLMNRMGEWVVHTACRQHREWRADGLPPIAIAVNVSPSQFRQPDFVSMLADTIHEFDIDPACLQLELTESTVMDNVSKAVATLNQLQSMGISISLDDFGTGYSSLIYLSSLPLDKLKIDQSFIHQMIDNPNSRSITEAIIALGRTLRLKVVGEGIESEASMEFLRHFGCDQAQGFFLSKPLPAHEFAFWYRQHLTQPH